MSESENPAIDAPAQAKRHRPPTKTVGGRTSSTLTVLRAQHRGPTRWTRTSTTRKNFKKLDVDALKADIVNVMRRRRTGWPADFGHYGG